MDHFLELKSRNDKKATIKGASQVAPIGNTSISYDIDTIMNNFFHCKMFYLEVLSQSFISVSLENGKNQGHMSFTLNS